MVNKTLSEYKKELDELKNDMKENVKNMMTNMSDMNEIEGKSVSIKDTSFQFQQDAKNLENKMRRQAFRNKMILFIVIACLLGIIIYMFLK